MNSGQVLDFTGGTGWAAGDLQLPVSWYEATHARTGVGYPINGDLTADRSFSKLPHSPRFPTPPFARVQGVKA